MPTRRELLRSTARSLLAVALWQTAFARGLLAEEPAIGPGDWARRLDAWGDRLRRGAISPARWQEGMDRLYAEADLEAIRAAVGFERLAASMESEEGRGEVFVTAPLRGAGSLAVTTKLARVERGRAIHPHGHENMVSAFLTLTGELRVRQYDKVYDDADFMWLRPTRDERQRPGDASSISDQRENVHWLEALADDTYLFSTKLVRLDPARPLRARVPVDVRAGESSGGVIRAPKIGFARARALYG